jgi:hypothetical protein
MLSDATGSVILAALLIAVADWLRSRSWRSEQIGVVGATVAVASVIGGVALAKCTALGNALASNVLGVARWPVDLVDSSLSGQGVSGLHPIFIVRDPYDVVAASLCAVVVFIVARRRSMAKSAGCGWAAEPPGRPADVIL